MCSHMANNLIAKLIFTSIIYLILGCSIFSPDESSSGQGIDLPSNFPNGIQDTISIGNRTLMANGQLWWNLMPPIPPSGLPFTSRFYVFTTDSSSLPQNISADYIWIIYQNQIWRYNAIEYENNKPYLLTLSIDTSLENSSIQTVDVVIRLVDRNSKSYYLKIFNQHIGSVH